MFPISLSSFVVYLADSLSSLICASVLERALRMCTRLCVCVLFGECVHGVQRLHFGDDCHRYHRRRLLWFLFVIVFIVIIIVVIICHHHPFCGSWQLDHAIVFESRPLAAV